MILLAWRNIWRNKRRTAITISSIFFAVLFSIFMLALQNGSWGRMIDNALSSYFGYGQIHKKGYYDDPGINTLMEYTSDWKGKSKNIEHLKDFVPRLESFAMASYGNQTKGVMINGIDPKKENALTKLSGKITEGKYLELNDTAVMIAEGLASQLKIGVGDTIVFISQGYHGVNSAGKYTVKGLLHFGPPDLNKMMVYMPLPEAQQFFGCENLISTLIIDIDDRSNLPGIIKKLKSQVEPDLHEVIEWEQLVPNLLAAKQAKLNGVYIFMLILYTIISFGIFGTILMMIKERSYEFGILIGIGMKRKLLSMVVMLEIILLGMAGVFAGV
ncbi:MAG TPA: ABC transporter permease, partial [Saprospirales bacterium]|nr:ABC transporter permease [Saprospirales bacterium]